MQENSTEIWMDVKGYEGMYQVSNLGRVKSLERAVERKNRWGFVSLLFVKEKIVGSSNWGSGYPIVNLCFKGKQKSHYVHCLVLDTFVGPCPKGMECRHLDGSKRNNRQSNLCWGTPKENSEDTIKHGRTNRGRRYTDGSHYQPLMEHLLNLKEQHGTWTAVGTVLGTSGNAIAVRASRLRRKIRERQEV